MIRPQTEHALDRATTVIVLAKQPVAGRAKTRLQASFTAHEAASLAAASLADTLAAVRACGAGRRVLAWQGDAAGWDEGFAVFEQPSGSLNDRLAAAFADAFAGDRGRALLIGMDTPQVTPELLDSRWEGADAVLGLSDDGGFWAVGFRDCLPGGVFDGIEMSTDRTGAAQLARLGRLGLSVRLLPPLRDIDLPADLDEVCYRHPQLRVSRRYTEILATRPICPVDRAFDELYRETLPAGLPAAGPLRLEVGRWQAPADAIDQIVVARSESPVLDLGCGPGRMIRALQGSGRAALGIDISAVAVAQSRSGGGLALRRRIHDPLPAEGRWGTALLLDGNIGIGGDVVHLLRRCRELVVPGGLIICEVDPDPERDDLHIVVLAGAGAESEPLAWAALGSQPLQRAAASLDLVVVEEWRAGARVFVALRSGRVS